MKLIPLIAACLFLPTTLSGQDLEVWFVDVGQGDCTLLRSPTGETFLFDGGDTGEGAATVVPLLQSLGISHLDWVSASHYHADHIGGLDEVWNYGIRTTTCLDRGDDSPPGTWAFSDYRNAYSSVRQTIQPGQVINLGGGVSLTCLCVKGELADGSSVDISQSSQWENSASIAWKVEFGDFDMWIGGDLTGGGNGTAYVEQQVAPLCGDVDVYQVNHHGSYTSSSTALVTALQPEFAIIPCGSANPYGYPKQGIIDRLNYAGRAIPVWSPTEGTGAKSFVDTRGTIHLSTDGNAYTVTAADQRVFSALCDEAINPGVGVGDVVTAEFLADPQRTTDSLGEWIEITGTPSQGAVCIDGLQIFDGNGGYFSLGTPFLLEQSEELLFAADGISARNGGTKPILVWPEGQISLGNTSGEIRLARSGSYLDEVFYDSTWPSGNGISAERIDLLDSGTKSNFSAGQSPFGQGDLGTPGIDNDADNTAWGSDSKIEIIVSPSLGGQLVMDWFAPGESGKTYQGWICLDTVPGIDVGGFHIPGNLDAGFTKTRSLPGFSGFFPTSEVKRVSTAIPNNPSWFGMLVHVLFVTYQGSGPSLQIRTLASPVPMLLL
ncbi:MAG TPA: hypothetical protein DDW23_03665 [Planctomycetes bacterium]|nr:hypothetical protein [Planctomycetota bacterium]